MKTPVFVFEPEKLKENYEEFESLCKRYLKKYKIAYSVKTNSEKGVLSILAEKNCGFEIASLNELEKIKKSEFVVFNSPAKTKEELEKAIKFKFLVNIDSKSEIDKIAEIIKDEKIELGLRVSLKEGKFGIEDGKIKEIIEYAKKKNIEICCLHFHQGTQISFKEYEEGIKKIAKILEKLKINLKYIDVGGGFPDKEQLKNLGIKLENYFSVIAEHIGNKATIILEPGRCLVSDAFCLLTKVIAIKENFGKKYVILDAGINLLPKITLASYKFSKFAGENEDEKSEYMLAGPLLFGNDILGRYYGKLKEKDIIKVENVGAYCLNLAWKISYKIPKVLIR